MLRPPLPHGRHPAVPANPGVLLAVAGLLASCGDVADRDRAGPPVPLPFDSAFQVVDRVALEETPSVVNVSIRVTPDPWGGWLVADGREAQVRRYAADGTLLWRAGRRGQGPGDFEAAVAAVRLPSGEVVVADRNGRLTFFEESGREVLGTVPTGIRMVEGLWALGTESLLISGHHPDGPLGPRLHVWSLEEERIEHSFFSPLPESPNLDVSAVVGWARAARRDDTIVATFTTMDTLFLFPEEGEVVRKVPLPPSRLRRVAESEDPGQVTDPRERFEILTRFDYVTELYAGPGGDLLLEYRSLVPHDEAGVEWGRWHLLGISPEGELLFEVRDAPRLLGRTEVEGEFVFQDPDSEVPGEWIVARARVGFSQEPVLGSGHLVRIRVREEEEELLAVTGRIGECWAAFYLGPPSDPPRRVVPVEFDREPIRSASVFVTADSVYGGGEGDPGEVARGRAWVRLDPDFVARELTGCW